MSVLIARKKRKQRLISGNLKRDAGSLATSLTKDWLRGNFRSPSKRMEVLYMTKTLWLIGESRV
jgi:hypothetical protein